MDWVIFSTKDFAEEFVLRRRRASPLIKPFLTPVGGRKRSECTGKFLNLLPLRRMVSRKFISLSEISAVNLIGSGGDCSLRQ